MTPAYEGDPEQPKVVPKPVVRAGQTAGHGRSHAAGGLRPAFVDRLLREACGHPKGLRDFVQPALDGLP